MAGADARAAALPLGLARPRGVLAALWAEAPTLTFLVYAVGIAHAELQNLSPARPELAWTCVFPFGVALVAFAVRWRRATRVERQAFALALGGSVGLITLSYLSPYRTPLEPAQLRLIYEISAITNTLVLMLHAARFGREHVLFFLGPTALYGLLLENGGIALGYFSELDYRLYLGPLPAPVATMSGWVTVFYVVVHVTWSLRAELLLLRRSAVASALVAALLGLLLDLQIDPLATTVGFWRWSPELEAGFLGVPYLNFVAWLAAVSAYGWVVFARQGRYGLSPAELVMAPHRTWLWGRVAVAMLVAAVLFFGTMAVVEGGLEGATFGILKATLVRWGVAAPDLAWSLGGT